MVSRKKPFDIVDATKELKAGTWSFFLDLKSWKAFRDTYGLTWHSVPFTPANKTKVPKVRGIYVFSVELGNHNLPPHGYVMYAGVSGLKGKSHLYTRYGQYLNEHKRRKARPSVVLMLQNWKEGLTFSYAQITDRRVSLKKLETLFLNAVQPPINLMDFSAEITKVRKVRF